MSSRVVRTVAIRANPRVSDDPCRLTGNRSDLCVVSAEVQVLPVLSLANTRLVSPITFFDGAVRLLFDGRALTDTARVISCAQFA